MFDGPLPIGHCLMIPLDDSIDNTSYHQPTTQVTWIENRSTTKNSIGITTFVSPVIFSIAFCAAIIADRCEFKIRYSNHAPGKTNCYYISINSINTPNKKNTSTLCFSKRKQTHFFPRFFFQETPLELFSDTCRFRITSLQVIAGDASLIFSGKSSPQAMTDPWDWYIYSGLHEWLTFMVHVGTLKATNISIHIPPNGKTKNLQKYFGRKHVHFFKFRVNFSPFVPWESGIE